MAGNDFYLRQMQRKHLIPEPFRKKSKKRMFSSFSAKCPFYLYFINYFINKSSLYFGNGQSSSSTSNSSLSTWYLIFSKNGKISVL